MLFFCCFYCSFTQNIIDFFERSSFCNGEKLGAWVQKSTMLLLSTWLDARRSSGDFECNLFCLHAGKVLDFLFYFILLLDTILVEIIRFSFWALTLIIRPTVSGLWWHKRYFVYSCKLSSFFTTTIQLHWWFLACSISPNLMHVADLMFLFFSNIPLTAKPLDSWNYETFYKSSTMFF